MGTTAVGKTDLVLRLADKYPIVLVHGFMASIGVWRFNIDSLSKSLAGSSSCN